MALPYFDEPRPGESSLDYITRELRRVTEENRRAGNPWPVALPWNQAGLTYLAMPDFKGDVGKRFKAAAVANYEQFLRALDDAGKHGSRGSGYLSPLVAQMAGKGGDWWPADQELYDWLWKPSWGAPSFPANPSQWMLEWIKAGSERQAKATAAPSNVLFEQAMNSGAWQTIQADVAKTSNAAITSTQKAADELLKRPDVQAAQQAQTMLKTAGETVNKIGSDLNNGLRSASDIVRYLPYIGIGVGGLLLLTVVIPALRRKTVNKGPDYGRYMA